MSILEHRTALTGFAALVLFTGLAADAWRNSISWYGYGALVLLITVLSMLILVRHRVLRLGAVPRPLTAFLILAGLSIAWSAYPAASALGLLAQLITTAAGLAIALVLDRHELLRALGWALRAILGLSLLFELFVSLVVRAPVLPVWATAEDRADPPVILYWSRNNLLEGERIQGIVGSWSLLGMVAVLALIVFGVQLASGRVGRITGWAWIGVAALTVVLTRSATIYLAIGGCLIVLAAAVVLSRSSGRRARAIAYGAMATTLAGLAVVGAVFREPILSSMGKSPDLTGRLDVWDAVIGLAQQRPVFGWGWVSFWPPWEEPFTDLVRRNGVMQLHAHNAWLDVWLQLGLIGVAVFGALVAVAFGRAWRLATVPRKVPAEQHAGAAASALPLLLLTALLVQSFAESRLLVEGGWLLLVVLATTLATASRRLRDASHEDQPARTNTPFAMRRR